MILTYTVQDGQGLRTANHNEYNLKLGQAWEDILAANLTANGLPTYRPQQQFIKAYDLQHIRERGKCQLKFKGWGETYEVLTGSPYFKPELLRPHQRDLLVKIGKVKRLSLEVKALCPAAFRQSMIQVGCCPKWDEKQFRVDALILINQETAEAFVAPEPETWLRQKGRDGGQLCYAVPWHLLSPLEAWVDYIKDQYIKP